MPQHPILTDAEFIELWKIHGSAVAIQKITKGNIRTIQRRRAHLETKYGLLLEAKNPNGRPERQQSAYER